jgi:hypothetical protein
MRDNQNKKMTLTSTLSNMINKKSYLEQYFKILKDYLKLNIEMSSGNANDDNDDINETNEFDEGDDMIINEGKIIDNNEEYRLEYNNANNHNYNQHIENHMRMNNDHNDSENLNQNNNNDLNKAKFHREKEDEFIDEKEEDEKVVEANPEFLK